MAQKFSIVKEHVVYGKWLLRQNYKNGNRKSIRYKDMRNRGTKASSGYVVCGIRSGHA